MTATAEPPVPAVEAPSQGFLDRADGLELLGPVHGSGYKDGAALVRRGDGQMVQLGPLMYALLERADGRRNASELADALSEEIGRGVDTEHVERLAEKLAGQGLLAGTEHQAPPRRNPLLALRWKVLVTDPQITRRLTAPLTILFRPWLMWPLLAAFAGVFWFVLLDKGVAAATAQAFNSPGLLLLVFALAVASAGFHELGHAAACRYGGATPGGMGMGLYLVWPAFYTDVTDAYRLPRRDRLRVDLGGLYFNAVVADVTLAAWLLWRVDALLLLVALQVLQMVKQLSPVIRADGYHILSDATGVPDLFSQMGPTLRRLIPGHHREPSALTGRARALVTAWVLIIVPVLLSLAIGAILLLPKLATTAWDSGRHIAAAIPTEAGNGHILQVLAAVVRLLALSLPVLGSVLVTQKVVRTTVVKASAWSRGNPRRRATVLVAGAAVIAALVWAWWPSGQYQPVRANQGGTLGSLVQMLGHPQSVARPGAVPIQAQLTPGTHLAVAMIPVGGATKRDPALYVVPTGKGKPAVAIVSSSAAKLPAATTRATPAAGGSGSGGGTVTSPVPSSSGTATSSTPASPTGTSASPPSPATAFPFILPARPRPGDTQALAVGTQDGGVTYDVAYALVTVSKGKAVTESNSAYALAACHSCTTVAVSFQVILVVGTSKKVTPINVAEALNDNCPACVTTAVADQIVVTLSSRPSAALLAKLNADLRQLGALPQLGANGTPTAIATAVAAIQQEIDTQLKTSGTLTVTGNSAGTSTGSSSSSATTGASTTSTPTTSTPTSSTPASSTPTTSTQTTSTTPTTTTGSTQSTPTQTSSSPTQPAAGSSTATTSTTTTTTSSTTPTSSSPATTQAQSAGATSSSGSSTSATTNTTATTAP